jgi:predicted component of type VI protein secretion system
MLGMSLLPSAPVGAFVEVTESGGSRLVALDGLRLTVGRSADNDVALAADNEVSRFHALLENVASRWFVRDLTSKNGTYVNSERIGGERLLRDGDEIRIGRTTLVFRGEPRSDDTGLTQVPERAPDLTRREREVLMALFTKAAHGELFNEPASTRDIATALSVSEAAVKQHLLHLYDKFGIYGEGERRRFRLANEALRRGVVNLAEVRGSLPKG